MPVNRGRIPVEVQPYVDMEYYEVKEIFSGSIDLERGQRELEPIVEKGTKASSEDEKEALSLIIEELNDRFGTEFSDEAREFIRGMERELEDNDSLKNSIRINTPENARLTFQHVANDILQDMINVNFEFYKTVTDDENFGNKLFELLFARYSKKLEE